MVKEHKRWFSQSLWNITLTNISLVILLIVFSYKNVFFSSLFQDEIHERPQITTLISSLANYSNTIPSAATGEDGAEGKAAPASAQMGRFSFSYTQNTLFICHHIGYTFPRKTKSAIMKMPTMILLLSCLTKTNNIIIK